MFSINQKLKYLFFCLYFRPSPFEIQQFVIRIWLLLERRHLRAQYILLLSQVCVLSVVMRAILTNTFTPFLKFNWETNGYFTVNVIFIRFLPYISEAITEGDASFEEGNAVVVLSFMILFSVMGATSANVSMVYWLAFQVHWIAVRCPQWFFAWYDWHPLSIIVSLSILMQNTNN